MWFWSKKKTLDFLTEFNEILDKKLDEAVMKIKELDQNKIYVIEVIDSSQTDLELFQTYLDKIKSKIKWTMPQIITINQELKEYTREELEELIKTKKVNK